MFFKKSIATLLSICSWPVLAQPQSADICIYGANAAGVIAAYSASKMGKSVILIEPSAHLGGMTSGGLGQTDIGNKYAITGLAKDFYRRLGLYYGKFEKWTFEPKVAKATLQQYLDKEKIVVLYSHRIVKTIKENGSITSVVLENSNLVSTSANRTIHAKVFIDCTYEGDLMALAGVSYVVGREANSEFNETINGVQLMHGHQMPDGIDPYKIPGNPDSGLLWGISDEQLLPNGTGDKKEQAYNFRICLTSDRENQVPITKPDGYDSLKYELLIRLFEKQPAKRNLNDYFIWSMMPNSKTDINNRGGFSTDMIGMNYSYPQASYEERKQIFDDHVSYTKGLLYFYGHDLRVPAELREEMLKWGYPKDEYVESGHWSPQLYVREARRMRGSYVMTQANCQGTALINDGVGMAAYTMDSHNCSRLVVNGMVKNEGNVEVGGFGPYPISYRSLVPLKAECSNLLVPVCLSATHIAYGSIRMEPVFMVLAQSSAIAAAMAIDKKTDVQSIDVALLQKKLKDDPLLNGSGPELLIDNDDRNRVTIIGDWTSRERGGYGPSFLALNANKESGKVRFSPVLTSKGVYEVFVYYTKSEGTASQTTFTVNDGQNSSEIIIREKDIMIEGQTSGEWVSLGKFNFLLGEKAYVEVSSKNADGLVLADAVILVPVN